MTSTWQPSVSVIVPVYNGAETIADCLDSLLALRYPQDQLELLVVDNGSRDRTAAVLQRYENHIVRLDESTRGPGAARNAGLRAANGEVVAFTDADCRADPGWLAAIVPPLEDRGVGIVGGTTRALPPMNEVERFSEVIHDHRQAIEVFDPPYVITSNWASRRSVLEELGGFDETFRGGEDVDLSYRVNQAGYSLVFASDGVIYHRHEEHLPGLFREGFEHGFRAVHVVKRHEEFVRALGHRRVDRHGYAAIGAGVRDWVRGPDRAHARCAVVFNSGKKAGKVLGSLRFGHLNL